MHYFWPIFQSSRRGVVRSRSLKSLKIGSPISNRIRITLSKYYKRSVDYEKAYSSLKINREVVLSRWFLFIFFFGAKKQLRGGS